MRSSAFVYQALPMRVVFRPGAVDELATEAGKLGRRALVLSTPDQAELAERAAERLGDLTAGVYPHAVMHVPVEVATAARSRANELGADICVAIGGGSTIGLAKAIALEADIPILAIPTTYAGSEMTPIWGLTEAGAKKTGRDARVLPRTVLYDPELTVTLPAMASGTSGINAIAHCVEALYAVDANPVISLMALEGIRALAESLPVIVGTPDDIGARSQALYGAWLGGLVLGSVGMALHHKLCHTLGGAFNLPHAETHAIVLPHAAAYNQPAATDALRRVASALAVEDPAQGLYDLAARVGAPIALRDIGMPADGIERATELATSNPYPNPRSVTPAGIRQLLADAWEGRRPQAV